VLEAGKVADMISERDVVRAFAAHRAEASEIKVSEEVMTRNVISCHPDESLTRVLALVTRYRRHLPVLEARRLAGLISIGDAVKHRLDELEMEAAVLSDPYIAAH
jgi:CBS domain-containing protein